MDPSFSPSSDQHPTRKRVVSCIRRMAWNRSSHACLLWRTLQSFVSPEARTIGNGPETILLDRFRRLPCIGRRRGYSVISYRAPESWRFGVPSGRGMSTTGAKTPSHFPARMVRPSPLVLPRSLSGWPMVSIQCSSLMLLVYAQNVKCLSVARHLHCCLRKHSAVFVASPLSPRDSVPSQLSQSTSPSSMLQRMNPTQMTPTQYRQIRIAPVLQQVDKILFLFRHNPIKQEALTHCKRWRSWEHWRWAN